MWDFPVDRLLRKEPAVILTQFVHMGVTFLPIKRPMFWQAEFTQH